MASDSTTRFPMSLYDSDDITNAVTSTSIMVSEYGRNFTKKMRCSIGDDVSQRITVLSVIMVCTIVGNLALILALTCKGSRRVKRVNVFLINLAIGDLAVAVFTDSSEILFLAFGDWALGPAACKIIVYMQLVTLASATFLLTAMSMDRYQVIVKPLQSLAQRPRIWMKVTVAWVMAFIFATPQLFIFLQITEEEDGVRRRCCVSKGYTEEWQRKVYLSFNTSYIVLVPTAIMIYCYAKIIHVVWIRARAEDGGHLHAVQGHAHRGTGQREPGSDWKESPGSPRMSMRRGLITASKRRVITMTLTVVVGFLICHSPYFILSLVRVYSGYKIKLPALLSLSENLVLMHSTLNPVLYGLFTLRSYHLTAMLQCLTCQDTPVSRGERRRLLLHGGGGGGGGNGVGGRGNGGGDAGSRGKKASGPGVQISRGKATADRVPSAENYYSKPPRNNGVWFKTPLFSEETSVSRDETSFTDLTSSGLDAANTTTTASAARKVDAKAAGRKPGSNTDVPLLLITNTAAVEGLLLDDEDVVEGVDVEEKTSSPQPAAAESQEQQSGVRGNPGSEKPGAWGKDVRSSVQQCGPCGQERSSVSCSQWTPCHVESNSECYTCV